MVKEFTTMRASGSANPIPRLDDTNDPTVQEISSWIATRLRKSDCGIELDHTHGVELVSDNDNVDLYIPYKSGSVHLDLRFPVSELDRASSQSLRAFVVSTVGDDLDRNTRFLLPFLRDIRDAFPSRSITMEIDNAWVNPTTQRQEDGLAIVLWEANGSCDKIVVSKQNAFYNSSPMVEIEKCVNTHNKFEKRVRNIVRMRYRNGIACAKSTLPLKRRNSCRHERTTTHTYASRKAIRRVRGN